MEDKEIINLYLARDETAIAATAEKYGRMLRSAAFGILGSETDSEECENDAYLAAWNRIPPEVPKALAAFLMRIVRNIALDRYEYYSAEKRSRNAEVPLEELGDIVSGTATPEAEYEASELSERISAFLRRESAVKRAVFVRRYWYCDSVGKIAEDFGFSQSKVKSMLMRMRNGLKKYLEREGIKL